LNQNGSIAYSSLVISAHVDFTVTGVSNLNKKGQIHIFEDITDRCYVGNSADSSRNNALLNEYPIQDLPKTTHYKLVDIMNMDSATALRYNFIPLSLYCEKIRAIVNNNNWTTTRSGNKIMGLIVHGAEPGTIIRADYEITLGWEIENNYINDYPPVWSNTYINPDPTLSFLQNKDVIIQTNKKTHNHYFVNLKKMQEHPEAEVLISGKQFLPDKAPVTY